MVYTIYTFAARAVDCLQTVRINHLQLAGLLADLFPFRAFRRLEVG